MDIHRIYRGKPFTFEYRIYYAIQDKDTKDFHMISPFHDIPLIAYTNSDGESIYNFICEVPYGTQAKMEISKNTKWNPIIQDTKKGKLRYVQYQNGYTFNSGMTPKSWEDPHHKFEETGVGGDNDPIDVCEIGSNVFEMGDIVHVKVLGCLAMIDDGETDWKLICINVDDPLAEKYNDIGDVDVEYLNNLREWFRMYKTIVGKQPNEFAMNEEFQNKEFAKKIIEKSHERWEKLVTKQCDPCGIQIDRYF